MSETPAPLKATLVKDILQVTGVVYQANIALFVIYISFFVYLVIPRGARKHFCNAYPKRHTRTRYIKHEVPTLVTTHRMSYDSIDDVEQNNLQFQTPSARSSHDIGCTAAFPLHPAPMILNPEKAWIMTGEALMLGPKTPAGGSMYSSPRGLFTSDRKRDRLGSTRTPLPPKIDENETMSPSSVVDQSMMSSSSSKRLLVLMSSRCLDRKQEIDQQEAFDLLRSRGVPFDRVDGMNTLHRKRYVYLGHTMIIESRRPA